MLGIAAGVGALAGGLSSWWQANEAKKQAQAHNRNVNKQLKDIRGQREQSIQRQSMTSGDFLNQYAMIRDPQRSQGIQQMYQQNAQLGQQERNRLDELSTTIGMSKQYTGQNALGAGLMGAAGGAMSGGMWGASYDKSSALPENLPGADTTASADNYWQKNGLAAQQLIG